MIVARGRGHCFEDGLSNEWGWSEHAESTVVGVSTSRSSEGMERVSADGCCGNDVNHWLGAFGLGGDGGVNVDPKRASTLLGGLIVIEVVEENNLLLPCSDTSSWCPQRHNETLLW